MSGASAATTSIWLTGSVLIGLVAGWLAGRQMPGNAFGTVGDVVAGILGAVLGGTLLHLWGLDFGGLAGRLIAAAAGAVGTLFLIHFLTGRRNGRRSWS